MSPMSPPVAPADQSGITLVGMIFETANGLRRSLTPALEDLLGVGGQSFEILLRLSRSSGHSLRMRDLAAQTGLSPSGLTRALDRLSALGLARREACPSDRRGALAILTDAGRDRMGAALEEHEREIARLLDGLLDADEVADLVALLRRLRDRVHEGALVGTGICLPGPGRTSEKGVSDRAATAAPA